MAKKKNKGNKKIATMYYRVSTKSEKQKSSIANQPKHFKYELQKQRWADFEECERLYCDYGLTATTNANRKEFVEMLNDAGLDVEIVRETDIPHPDKPHIMTKQISFKTKINPTKEKKFDYIFVKDSSRFTRNLASYEVLENLWRNGVYVYFMDRDIDTKDWETVNGDIASQIAHDQEFSQKRSRDRQYTQAQYIRENRVSGKCYGWHYHKVKDGREPYYTINPEQAPIAERMYDLSIEGNGTERISQILTSEGLVNAKGNPFSKRAVSIILDNPKYMGYNTIGRFEVGTLNAKYIHPYNSDYYEMVKSFDKIPPIVSEEKWWKEKEERAKRTDKQTNRGSRPIEHPFKDILVCGYCRNGFIYDGTDNSKSKPHFRCKTKRSKGAGTCNCNNVSEAQLNLFIETLRTHNASKTNISLYDIIEQDFENTAISLITIVDRYFAKLNTPTNMSIEEKERLQKSLEAKKTSRRLKLQRQDTCEDVELVMELNDQIDSLNKEIKAIEEQLSESAEPIKEIVGKIQRIIECIDNDFKLLDRKRKTYSRDEVLEILSKIEVYGKTVIARKSEKNVKAPSPILIPILKQTELAEGLIALGETEFNYKFKNLMSWYDPSLLPSGITEVGKDEVLSMTETERRTIFDATDLSIEDRYDLMADKTTKSEWEKGTSKYVLSGDAFDLESGYIIDLGLENHTIMDQIKIKVEQLKTELQQYL